MAWVGVQSDRQSKEEQSIFIIKISQEFSDRTTHARVCVCICVCACVRDVNGGVHGYSHGDGQIYVYGRVYGCACMYVHGYEYGYVYVYVYG